MLIYQNRFYMGRLWVNFVHIFFALIAYAGAALLMSRHSPALSALGYLWFLFWGFIELLGVSILIFAVNYNWRASFVAADSTTQILLETHIQGFLGIWDAMFFLLLIAFLLGTTCYGVAAVRQNGFERLVGILFLLAVPLTLIITLDGYAGMSLSGWIAWSYPILQPVSRFLLGIWIWRSAKEMQLVVEPETELT